MNITLVFIGVLIFVLSVIVLRALIRRHLRKYKKQDILQSMDLTKQRLKKLPESAYHVKTSDKEELREISYFLTGLANEVDNL